MSRAYKITVNESLRREILAADEVRSRLELLAILPPEATAALLKAELLARGFTEQADGTLNRSTAATVISVDPCTGEVSVKTEAKKEVTDEATGKVVAWDDVGEGLETAEAKLRESLRKNLEAKASKSQEAFQASTTAELERALADLQPELAAITNKVTREALKQRAAQLGSVVEVAEDDATGSLTIRVEV